MSAWWPVVAATLCFWICAGSQLSDNTPPIMWLDRNWRLPETEPVGNVITRVRAEDNEQDKLTYGLEPHDHYNGNKLQPPLPFFIDNRTGIVFLNETLKGRAGQNLLLYVTVSDGQLTAKTEVYVNIENASAPNRGKTRIPYSNQHGSGGRIRPPFGIPNIGIPNLSSFPSPLPPLPPKQYHPETTKLEIEKLKPKENDSSVGTISTNTATEESVRINEVEGTALSSKVTPSAAPPSQDMAMTLVPVAAGCALVVGLGMGAWSLRNRFCGSRKSKTGTEQASVSVSNLSDDPSLVLKRWRGPKAHNNRYQPWEKEFQTGIQNKQEDKWEFPRHRLKVFNILGEGCFGQVWKCEALDIDGKSGPTIVAVKTLKENATERERLDLAQELRVMKNLDPHPNVVRLLGCCTEREPMFVILEYVSGGKLQSFLRASREERNHGGAGLTSRDLTGFVYQIAKGMEYLASKGIIHRDLAARNILIDENRACKVADFGFARDVAANQIYERKSEGRLPIRWMAPESLYDNIFSVKSDIWSFGVLIWEIVTLGSTPYPGLAAAEVMRKIKEGYRLDRPEHCKRELYNIMYYCWDKDPACRPSFGELVNLTEGLLLDETDYIELDRFPDHSYYNVLNLSGEKL
ncbi:tyrosine kinase receptor Cad96Ca isoform X2 [Monomorium pharaonis]|uniref:tyrosine kinase receptor Cad96Ca isoform X2 n=1 Tax=Monomorium pharaonis TaxID=307658 RepID=UPI00063FBD98|nr:tyrosine kinase receptor Cad96Ca isoform X2 [Monomorium pharaonis]